MSDIDVTALRNRIQEEVSGVIVGQEEAVDLLITALLTGGNVLLEGPPGTAKTLLGRAFAAALSLEFGRIQFTPDLMPGDVLGMNLFNFDANAFVFSPGPIFTEILLADEVNRTPPKTQAALLEAMNERTVTIDGKVHVLSDAFMVIATQNPIEQQGTYPLPEAQLDRFLFKHVIGYPELEAERDIVRMATGAFRHADRIKDIIPVTNLAGIQAARAVIRKTTINDEIIAYAVDLARATRNHAALDVGVSPRAAAMLASAARTVAVLDGRDYVVPDDVKMLATPVMRHRVILTPGAEIDGQTSDSAVAEVIASVNPPR